MAKGKIYILGLSCFYHDSAACLVENGKIIAAAQEERFTRKKNDHGFPRKAIEYCLREAGLTIDHLNYVVFYDKPLLTFERLILSYLSVAPKGLRSWLENMPAWLKEKLHVPRVIKKETGYSGPVLFTEHHEAHAASAFYPSPYREAAVLTMDGVGEWATASYGTGQANEICLLKELHFPDSLGLLYSAFTYFTGFKVNSGEYKLMGLAPYGKAKYKDLILQEIVDLKEDGSIRLDLSYFNFLGGQKITSSRFADLFGGPPREPETEITSREMDLAASIQAVTEEIVMNMVNHVYAETGLPYLCLAGGVALNGVANGRILREGPFKDVWIQPAAGDAGGALGAALSVWYRYLDNERTVQEGCDAQQGSFLGPAFANETVKCFLEKEKYPFHPLKPESRSRIIAEQIASGKIVGYMSGRMEFGPRALGARSILGDPRQVKTQSVMNLKIKHRESFRPFAPSVLEERISDYFDLDRPSPYMLLVAYIREGRRLPQPSGNNLSMLERLEIKRSDVPSITHVDYSARVQSVNKDVKPDYYDLICEFEKLTGCGVIVNTSFNVRGEPIICTPDDAYRCFMRTEMEVLVMEDCLLFKEEQPEWKERNE